MTIDGHPAWPALPLHAWQETCATLHLWTQVIGKIRLARTPWLNHSWHVALYVNHRGLTTSLIPFDDRAFEIQFDFIDHALDIGTTDGAVRRIELRPQSVAAFHGRVMSTLAEVGIIVPITNMPCEIEGAIPFDQDMTHAAYDAEYANRFWRALVQVDRVFKRFRTGFLGKSSPVHFFWGSFDLAVTRFSGRRAPMFTGSAPGVDARIMQEAYSHEVSSAGFWPGGRGVDASFYSYAYPAPDKFSAARVAPDAAHYSDALGEFLLPYEAVRTSQDPDASLMEFLETTYAAAADAAHWDRATLDSPFGMEGQCRDPRSSDTDDTAR